MIKYVYLEYHDRWLKVSLDFNLKSGRNFVFIIIASIFVSECCKCSYRLLPLTYHIYDIIGVPYQRRFIMGFYGVDGLTPPPQKKNQRYPTPETWTWMKIEKIKINKLDSDVIRKGVITSTTFWIKRTKIALFCM